MLVLCHQAGRNFLSRPQLVVPSDSFDQAVSIVFFRRSKTPFQSYRSGVMFFVQFRT